ncbi:MAG: hypothetical protein ACERKO_09960 [Acetanaerobacterium sp.]
MQKMDYALITDSLVTQDIVNLVSAIHEYKGQQSLFIEAKHDILTNLLEIAKIQSTEASKAAKP